MRRLLPFVRDLFGPEEPVVPAPVPPALVSRPFVPLPSVSGSLFAMDSGSNTSRIDPGAESVHPRANRVIVLDGLRLGFELRRSARRSIGFVVTAEGLVVSAPRALPLHAVDAALVSKSGWVLRKLVEVRQRRDAHADAQARLDWRDGAQLPYLGAPLRLVLAPPTGPVRRGAVPAVLHEAAGETPAQHLRLALHHGAAAEQIREATRAWLLRQAHQVFTGRLDHFAPQLGVRWRSLALSNAGTRWGSARVDGAIRLNWRLVHTALPIIDYVVVHELSHLREMNHSPRFWATVASVMPDYAERRGALKALAVPRW
jgi:hypothetical protein